MDERYFTITTTREVAEDIENVLNDPLHSERSIRFGQVSHQDN